MAFPVEEDNYEEVTGSIEEYFLAGVSPVMTNLLATDS
jgi:hypothetical protein